jgi:nicotinamidase-related amidase
MAEPLVLEAKKCAFILIDMTNVITKGQGPPYTTSPPITRALALYRKVVAALDAAGTTSCNMQ